MGEGSESGWWVLEGCGLTGMGLVSASHRGWDAKRVFLFLFFFKGCYFKG